eukprot:CFRG4212T1
MLSFVHRTITEVCVLLAGVYSAIKISSSLTLEQTSITDTMPKSISRSVVKNVLAREQSEGASATVRRSIGRPEMRNFDPFLLLDEFSVTESAGFPTHPHRGFETVTYMLKGAFSHEDFAGHKGIIYPGDLQWMTAGRGIVHSELPVGKDLAVGLQLWVNLSKKDKLIKPGYQELRSDDITKVKKDGVHVAVIAGDSMGVSSKVYTLTPTMYLDVTMEAGSNFTQDIPYDYNTFVYTLEGIASFGPDGLQSKADPHTTLIFSKNDTQTCINVSVAADAKQPARFVLIGGRPTNEPIVQHGPFVMTTQEGIRQTFEDYQQNKNGFEGATSWVAKQDKTKTRG